MQVPETRFQDMQELKDWVNNKVSVCNDPEHPTKVCSNWWLTEFWFVHEKGTLYSTSSKVSEEMQREASDLSAGMAVLGEASADPSKKKPKQSVGERHKSQLGRTTTMVNRLGRAIAQAEASMPSLKRAIASSSQFAQFRAGVERCRQAKETLLDQLEDHKVLAGSADDQEMQVEKLKHMFKVSAEHLDAISESNKRLEPPPPEGPTSAPEIKDEAAEQQHSQVEGDPGSDDGTNSQK